MSPIRLKLKYKHFLKRIKYRLEFNLVSLSHLLYTFFVFILWAMTGLVKNLMFTAIGLLLLFAYYLEKPRKKKPKKD